jgi:hypothetical protein
MCLGIGSIILIIRSVSQEIGSCVWMTGTGILFAISSGSLGQTTTISKSDFIKSVKLRIKVSIPPMICK